jgi:transposase
MGELSDFETGQIIGARLAGAPVIKSATLLGALRATVSDVMSAYTNHGKKSAKRNSGRKSTLTERDRHTLRTVSKNHRTAAAQVTVQLKCILKDPFPQEVSEVRFRNPISTVGLQLLNL